MKNLTILFTSCGHEAFEGALDSMRTNGERNIRVIGADANQTSHGLYMSDAAYLVPRDTDPRYIPAIIDICKKEKVDVIYPLASGGQSVFYGHESAFGIPILVQPREGLEIADNKFLLCKFAEKHNIDAPQVFEVKTWDDVQNAASALGFPEKPFVLKRHKSSGAKGLKIIYDTLDPMERFMSRENQRISMEELRFHLLKLSEWPQMHVAEYLPGNEYSVDVLCKEGKIYATVVRKRYSAIGGSSKVAEVVDEEDLSNCSTKLAQALKLTYIVNLQWRRDAKGTPKIMEINPRIPATIHQTIKAGVNMPYMAVKLALGEEIIVPKEKLGTMVIKYYGSVFIQKIDLLNPYTQI